MSLRIYNVLLLHVISIFGVLNDKLPRGPGAIPSQDLYSSLVDVYLTMALDRFQPPAFGIDEDASTIKVNVGPLKLINLGTSQPTSQRKQNR